MSRFLERVALWLCLVLPSVFTVHKFFGWLGFAVYGLVAACAVVALPCLRWRLKEREALWLSLVTFAGLGVLFAVGYPIVNTHISGTGSDDDDAINIAVRELVHGHYPYYARTYLGNLIHHMPGALLLAVPFVLLGTSALQNLVWLVLFFLVVRRELKGSFAALRWFWLMLIASPVVLHQLITGTGHVTNAIYVMLGLWWLVNARQKALAAATWGIALSSRANFLFLVPLAFGSVANECGRKAAFKFLLLTCLVFTLLTLPFYLYDRAGFAPLEAVDRLTRFEAVLSYAGWIIGIGMGLSSLILGWKLMETSSALWRYCAFVQGLPVLVGFLLSRDLAFLSYGCFFLCFGIFAAITRKTNSIGTIDRPLVL